MLILTHDAFEHSCYLNIITIFLISTERLAASSILKVEVKVAQTHSSL